MAFNSGEREVKKERILNATFRCVSRYGIDGVTLRSIAQEAKLNPALLHYYFRDKENLLEEFIQYLYGRFLVYVESQVDPKVSPENRVDALFYAAMNFVRKQKDLFVVFIDVWSFCLRSSALQKRYANIYKKLVGFLETILDQRPRQGTAIGESTEALAYHFAALVVGLGTLWHMDKKSFDIESQFKFFKETFEALLLRNQDAAFKN